jgi:LysR family transcriptional regulator, glycine cleavage system transcriptional activator
MLNAVSLHSIRAFEAAGRLGSFRAAATELNLSPSAVSHAIVKLERTLGTSLFARSTRRVQLTVNGETLMQHCSAAFEQLRIGIDLVAAQHSKLLRLHSAPSFAALILSPRLPHFLAANPDIEVRIAASTDYARFTDDEFDADLVYGKPTGDNLYVIPLGEETVTPLCSPDIAKAIRKPEDLFGATLIRSDTKQVRWTHWFEVNGMAAPHLQGMSFDRSFMAIAAAADGLGIALESTRLARRELSDGRLVAPLSGVAKDVSYIGHHLSFPKSGSKRRLVRRFANWLLVEIGEQPLPEA